MPPPANTVASAIVLAAGLFKALRTLQGGSNQATKVTVHVGDHAQSSATEEERGLEARAEQLIQNLSLADEVPIGTVIEVPTSWPAKVGEEAITLVREGDKDFTAERSTFTASVDHALAVVSGGSTVVLAPDDPLATVARLQAGVDDKSLRATDEALERLKVIGRIR
jgi:hypothetical protein